MSLAVTLLLALALLLSPLYAAIPDDPFPIGSSWLCAGTLLAACLALFAAWRGDRTFCQRLTRSEKAFLVLLALAFLSIPMQLALQHGGGYFGLMLRGWAMLASSFAAYSLARRVSTNRLSLYGLVLAAVVSSVIVADIGVQEYIAHWKAGESYWRIFGTSTPDFLAGYIVLLLPVTLAIFLQMPSQRGLTPLLRGLLTLVIAVILLFQLVTLLTTGSRFALFSLLIALFVFAWSLWSATRHGLVLGKATRLLLGGLAVVLLLGSLLFARPVLVRLQNLNDNSTAFRAWTWKGAVHMAVANPVLGTGIGAWSDQYPRYAYTGFTRAAHQSYLQLADECGIPALIALLVALGTLCVSLRRGLTVSSVEPSSRLLLCGLSAAVAGGIVQNLIDSDWSVFFLSCTFWTFAGMAARIAEGDSEIAPTQKPSPLLLVVGGVTALLISLYTGAQGIAAVYGAGHSYETAQIWDPLNADYPSNLGYLEFYSRQGDLPKAETSLRLSVSLEPNSVNYRKLGDILQQFGRQPEALEAYETGLKTDPHNLLLLQRLAKLSPAPHNLEFYKRISDLELTPVGMVRALGESTETTFAYGDAVMGDEAAPNDPTKAKEYYARAAQVLEKFADEGGSSNVQQQALNKGNANPKQDEALRGLYAHVLTAWIALASPAEQDALKQREEKYRRIYDAVVVQSSKPGIL